MTLAGSVKGESATVRGVPVNSEEMRAEGYRLLEQYRGTKICPLPDCGKKVQYPQRVYCSYEHSWEFSTRYFGVQWDSIRREIIKRDNHVCRICGDTHSAEKVEEWKKWHAYCGCEVDHIVEVADGGTDDRQNLRVLCHDCHISKTKDAAYKRRQANKDEGIIEMEP